MAFRYIAGLVATLLLSTNTWADELNINPQHPEQYTVVESDTLWDISAKFLKSPWLWHKLWHANPQIKNPDLIYPGDTLFFSISNGKPSLRLSRSREVKLHPSVRATPLDAEIKTIPSDAISQFLTTPKVLDNDELDNSPYVIDFKGEHLVVGAGDRVYVRSIWQADTLDYTLYRKGQPYVSPETGETLGYEAIYIASADLEKEGDPATLLITKSEQEVRIGDRLMPNSEKTAPLNYFPKPPEHYIKGNIISVLNGVSQIGQYNVVVIDKGLADGVKVGDLFEIYHKGAIVKDSLKTKDETVLVKLPNEIAGSLMVFRVFNRVSYALVMEANQAIHVLDKFKTAEEN
jgi:LysM domain